MTTWCKHLHRLELRTFFNCCVAHYIPVKRDIKTEFPYFLLWKCMSEIRNREFYICFFATSFSCFSFSFPSPQQIRNASLYLLLCGFFLLLFLLFCHETKFHISNSSMLCQLQLPSSQLHLTTMMEKQKSNAADGTWGRSTGKNEKYSDPRPFHTRFANWHIRVADTTKLCTDTARWCTYTIDSVGQRDIPWHSVNKRDMSSNGVGPYRDRRQRD